METKFTAADIDRMLEVGGNRWQKNGMDRVYFNGLASWYGLETTRYNSGNICGATLNGESISNNRARKIIDSLYNAKIWFDVPTEQFMGRNIEQGQFDEIVKSISKAISGGDAAAEIAS